MSFKQRLAAMKEGFQVGKVDYEANFSGQKIPEGEYEGRISNLEIKESKNGNLYIKRTLVVVAGEYEGVPVSDNVNFDPSINERGWAFTLNFLAQCGVMIDTPEELEEALVDIVKGAPIAHFTCKHNGDFMNFRINEIVGAEYEGEEEESDEVEPGQDELPFDEPETEDEPEVEDDEPEADEEPEAEEDEPEAEEVDPFTQKLIDFCERQGIDVDDEMSADDIKAEIGEYTYPSKKKDPDEGLEKDDILFLIELGFGGDVEYAEGEKAPKKAAKKKVTKKKAAKKK